MKKNLTIHKTIWFSVPNAGKPAYFHRKVLCWLRKLNRKPFRIECTMLLTLIALLSAAPVDLPAARTVAENFVIQNNLQLKISDSFDNIRTDKQELAYIFNCTPQGYIAVSADDELVPVIAYSESGAIDNQSPMVSLIRQDLAMRLANLVSQKKEQKIKQQEEWNRLTAAKIDRITAEQWPAAGTTATGGWTTTRWKQSSPYNKYCPMDQNTNQRSITGCPSTAMSQILYYHKVINSTRFDENDRYRQTYWQTINFDEDWETLQFLSFPQLNMHLDTIEVKFSSGVDLNNSDKAALNFACGMASHTVYSSSGSGTFGIAYALRAFQRFGFNNATLLDHNSSDDEIRMKMVDNIKAALPVQLGTVNEAWSTGHNVVVDGYRDNDYFRINMGWGGNSDGWYKLPEGFPLQLTVFEGVVADIKAEVSISEKPDNPKIRLDNYPNPFNPETTINYELIHSAHISLAVYNAKGELVKNVVNQFQNPGQYQVDFDACNLNSGIYFCKLTAGKNTSCKKMALVH